MKRVRLIGAALVLALSAGACAGADEVYEVAPGEGAAAAELGAFEELSLPPAVPAVPAYVVRSKRPLSGPLLARLRKMPGVAVVAPFALQRTRATKAGRRAFLNVAFVDPVEFRSVAPPSTRGAEFVWFSLLGGDAVLTEEAARRVRLGRKPRITTALGRLTVGAIADNGTPNIADALVDAAATKGGPEPRQAVIGAATGTSLESLAGELRAVGGLRLRRLIPQGERIVEPPAPSGGGETVSVPVVAGLHPALSEAVGRLLAAAGGRVYVVSGFRDSQRQYELWVGALQRYGSPEKADDWVARPGHSMHEYGLAVDLGGDVELAARLIHELGLPLWRPMSHEPWHFELVGSRG